MTLEKIIKNTLGDMKVKRETSKPLIIGRKCMRCKSPTESENLIKPKWYNTDQDSKVCLICHDYLFEKRERIRKK